LPHTRRDLEHAHRRQIHVVQRRLQFVAEPDRQAQRPRFVDASAFQHLAQIQVQLHVHHRQHEFQGQWVDPSCRAPFRFHGQDHLLTLRAVLPNKQLRARFRQIAVVAHDRHACRGEFVGAPKRHLDSPVAAPLHRLAIVEGPLHHAVRQRTQHRVGHVVHLQVPNPGQFRMGPRLDDGFAAPGRSTFAGGELGHPPVERRMARVAVGHAVATAHRVPFFRAPHVGVHELRVDALGHPAQHLARPHALRAFRAFVKRADLLNPSGIFQRKHRPAKIHPLAVNHPIDQHALREIVGLEDRGAAGGQPALHVQRAVRQQIGRRDARLRHTP